MGKREKKKKQKKVPKSPLCVYVYEGHLLPPSPPRLFYPTLLITLPLPMYAYMYVCMYICMYLSRGVCLYVLGVLLEHGAYLGRREHTQSCLLLAWSLCAHFAHFLDTCLPIYSIYKPALVEYTCAYIYIYPVLYFTLSQLNGHLGKYLHT